MTNADSYNQLNEYACSTPTSRTVGTYGEDALVRAQAELMVCIYAKDPAGIKAIFASSGAADLIDSLRSPRYFPVHAAVAAGHLGVLRALVDALPAAALDVKDETTRTPLMHAAEQGMSAAVHTLLAGHASVDVADRSGCSALMCAAAAGHADTVKVLLGYEVCEGDSNSDHPVGIDRCDQNGNTALMLAVRAGHYEVVETLIARGADMNAANFRGERALSIAIALGRHRMIRLLCEQKELDLNATDPKGVTALMQAADYASTTYDSSILNLLLKQGIQTERTDHDGYTAMLRIARYGSDIALECLLAGGASPDAVDSTGCCAVALAAKTNNVLVLRYLLQLQRHWVDAQDHGGRTPLFHAVINANREAAKLLIKHGANVNLWHDASNVDLLTIARRRGDPAIISLLIENGACDGEGPGAASRSRLAAACVA